MRSSVLDPFRRSLFFSRLLPTTRTTTINQLQIGKHLHTFKLIRSLSTKPSDHDRQLLKFDPLVPLKILNPIGKKTVFDGLDQHELDSGVLGQMADQSFAVKVYSIMLGLPIIETMMNNLQRHGRISFYMTSYGEEGAVVGSAAALGDQDEVFAQYREQGVLLWRGCSLDYLTAQCFGTVDDKSSMGRQMPVHYASKAHHFFSVSSPLATQIPQAAGAAYALKRMRQKGERPDDCIVCYLGEGAASEGDFHAGVNMASVLGGPIIFFIRNNGFAISTPSSQQYKGDGIASRAAGYGIDAIRVDGNDPIAVYLATREARRRAMEGNGRAVMVEAMTYRVGHHSTSDDSSAYRNPSDVDQWRKQDNPINRMRNFLEARGWWDQSQEDIQIKQWKSEISKSVKKTEKMLKPGLEAMWTDVYGTPQPHLHNQRLESQRLITKWSAYQVYKDELKKFSNQS